MNHRICNSIYEETRVHAGRYFVKFIGISSFSSLIVAR